MHKDVAIITAAAGRAILQPCLKYQGLKGMKMRLPGLLAAGLQR